jgi:hypothetical protein
MHTNAVSTDGREMPLLTVISETLKYIADKAIEKLTEQVFISLNIIIYFSRLER